MLSRFDFDAIALAFSSKNKIESWFTKHWWEIEWQTPGVAGVLMEQPRYIYQHGRHDVTCQSNSSSGSYLFLGTRQFTLVWQVASATASMETNKTLDAHCNGSARSIYLIVSTTNLSIVIGSPPAYLSRNRRVITWVSNYRWPIWSFVIGYLSLDNHAIFTSVMRALMASLQCFLQFSKLTKSATDVFAQKKFSKDIFIPKFVTDTIN